MNKKTIQEVSACWGAGKLLTDNFAAVSFNFTAQDWHREPKQVILESPGDEKSEQSLNIFCDVCERKQ
jgi:hypothetical protein